MFFKYLIGLYFVGLYDDIFQSFHCFCKIATKIRADEIRAGILIFQNCIQRNVKGNFLLLGAIPTSTRYTTSVYGCYYSSTSTMSFTVEICVCYWFNIIYQNYSHFFYNAIVVIVGSFGNVVVLYGSITLLFRFIQRAALLSVFWLISVYLILILITNKGMYRSIHVLL